MNGRLFRMFAGVAGGLFLAGCVSAPTPGSRQEAWTPPRDALKPDTVWQAVRAQAPDLSKPLALADLADLALRNSPACQQAWSEAHAAAAQVDQAQGLFMPEVTAVAGVSRLNTDAKPDSFNQGYLKAAPALQVNYLILNFGGGRRAAVEQALQTVYAADFAFNQALQDTLLAVETAYYSLASAEAGIEAAQAGVKDTDTALNAARERKAAGTGTELEVLQAQASSDQARYVLAHAEGLVKIARGELARAAGLAADAPLRAVPPTGDLPPALTVQDVGRLLDEALARRPDIAALRAGLAARESGVKVASAALWPSLYLDGSLAYDTFNDLGGREIQDRDWASQVGLSLRWTLFDGNQTRSARRAARDQADAARARLRQAELAAGSDVWSRYQSYETALQKLVFSTAFLKSATASYDLALDSYKAGLRSILDLLNAESLTAQARSQQIAARQDAFTALTRLAHAVGLLEKGGSARAPDLLLNPSQKKDDRP